LKQPKKVRFQSSVKKRGRRGKVFWYLDRQSSKTEKPLAEQFRRGGKGRGEKGRSKAAWPKASRSAVAVRNQGEGKRGPRTAAAKARLARNAREMKEGKEARAAAARGPSLRTRIKKACVSFICAAARVPEERRGGGGGVLLFARATSCVWEGERKEEEKPKGTA